MPRLRLKRIPGRYRSVGKSVALSVAMSGVVTFLATVRVLGISFDMLAIWLAAWQVSCAIAVPARFVVGPLVERCVGALFEPEKGGRQGTDAGRG